MHVTLCLGLPGLREQLAAAEAAVSEAARGADAASAAAIEQAHAARDRSEARVQVRDGWLLAAALPMVVAPSAAMTGHWPQLLSSPVLLQLHGKTVCDAICIKDP